MSLSNQDVQTLEALKQFKAFFEMVQNPKKFSDIVAQADKTLADMKAVVEAFTTVELANEYLTKAKTFANEKTTEIEAKVQVAQEAANKRQAQVEALRADAEVKMAAANKAAQEVETKQTQLATAVAALEVEKAEVATRADELYKKEVQLQTKEKELNQKAAKLKELLG